MDNSLYIFKMSKYRDCSLSDINSGVAFSLPTEPTKPETFSIFPQLTDTRNCVKMSDLSMSLPCKINLYAPQRYLRRLRYRLWGIIFKSRHYFKQSSAKRSSATSTTTKTLCKNTINKHPEL